MSTLTRGNFAGTIKPPEEMLSLWMQVEADIAETGQSYRSPGGVEVTLAEIGMVRQQVRYWENRVLMARGMSGRNYADIEGDKSESRSNL